MGNIAESDAVSLERLEDVFQKTVVERFQSIQEFYAFARSSRGLNIDQSYITTAKENNPHSVEEQKWELFGIWKQNKGDQATANALRQSVANYFCESQQAQENMEVASMEAPLASTNGTKFVVEGNVSGDNIIIDSKDVNIGDPNCTERDLDSRKEPEQNWPTGCQRSGSIVTVKRNARFKNLIVGSENVKLPESRHHVMQDHNRSRTGQNDTFTENQETKPYIVHWDNQDGANMDARRDRIGPNMVNDEDDIGSEGDEQSDSNIEDLGNQNGANMDIRGEQNRPNKSDDENETGLHVGNESDELIYSNMEDLDNQNEANMDAKGGDIDSNMANKENENGFKSGNENHQRSDSNQERVDGANMDTRGEQNKTNQTRVHGDNNGIAQSGPNLENLDRVHSKNRCEKISITVVMDGDTNRSNREVPHNQNESNMDAGEGKSGLATKNESVKPCTSKIASGNFSKTNELHVTQNWQNMDHDDDQARLNEVRANVRDALKQDNAEDGNGQNGLKMNDTMNENELLTESASSTNMDTNMDGSMNILNADQVPEVEDEQNGTKMDQRKHQNSEQLPDLITQCWDNKSSSSGAGVHGRNPTTVLHEQVQNLDEGRNESMPESEMDACGNSAPNLKEGSKQSITESLHQTDELRGEESSTVGNATTLDDGQQRKTEKKLGCGELPARFTRSNIICGVIVVTGIGACIFAVYRQRTKTT